jgi:succinate dehydrogenase / fumarate reductase flavoprotein subunit
MAEERVIVVGGGLAGLATVIKCAEAGVKVDLFSLVPVKRSHSVCAQGGINGAVNTKGEGDHPDLHFDDTVYGGDFLANQPPVKLMCYAAPGIINLLDRMGVTFNRTPEGLLDFRRFGGTLYHRTAFAGATTGQQLLYALDEQVRRFEDMGRVNKYEFWDMMSVVLDDEKRCRGIVAQDLRTMEIKAFGADAVMLATGGPGLLFGLSTNSMLNTGSAAAIAYQQGVKYANGEFIQVHPTAIPGEDKCRLMSESVRGEGGRVWVPKKQGDERRGENIPEGERDYFLEEKYPKYKNLVPRDIATREIFAKCVDEGMGVHGKNQVYLDVTHKDPKELDKKLKGVLEIYEKFVGDDPRKVPMRIFPAVHYSMGGLWVGYERREDGHIDLNTHVTQMTNIPGLYASGEAEYQYHGANRLGANSLISCIYGGFIGGPAMVKYIRGFKGKEFGSAALEQARKKQQEKHEQILKMSGSENPFVIQRELGAWMNDNVTVVRHNKKLKETDDKILELMDRWKKVNVQDAGGWSNQPAVFVRHLECMLHLGRVVTQGALLRNESRGAHYKPEFPERDDENWQKTTIAEFSESGPKISYESIDCSMVKPRPRKYT